MTQSWTFYEVWNKSLDDGIERQPKQRDYIWATELGGSYIDRFYKMRGEPFTNPPNPRSKRKFEAGNFFEATIGYVLKRAGILISPPQQTILVDGIEKDAKWVKYKYDNLLAVVGKWDLMAGGKPDYEKAIYIINNEFSWLPESMNKATKNIIEHLQKTYPNGLKEVILEIKSTSGMMFDSYERLGTGNINHKLQLFHYLKAKNFDEGHLIYISRDDLRLLEIGVFNPSPLEEIYKRDIELMTEYYRSGQEPPKEKEIIWDDDLMKFSQNWKIAYSNYLTKLYGYKNQMEYEQKIKPIVTSWNRVLTRAVKGEKLTDKNKIIIEEISQSFNFNELVDKRKQVQSKLEEEQEIIED